MSTGRMRMSRRGEVRIRLLVGVAGRFDDLVNGQRGDIFTVPVEVARKWCDGERAELVEDEEDSGG